MGSISIENPVGIASQSVPRTRPTLSFVPAERLFAALDGRELAVQGRRWQVEIYGIFDRAGCRWVQMALDGESHHMLTVKAVPGAGVAAVVPGLVAWLAKPTDSPTVLSLA